MAGESSEPASGSVSLDWRAAPPAWACHGVVSVGNFDGIHRGHAALVAQARKLARSVDGPLTVVTFDPHPLQLLAPERFQPQLTTPADRAALLRSVGADAVVTLRTDPELLNLSAEEFFKQIVIERFAACGVVEGFNFRFGKDRVGDLQKLRDWCGQRQIAFDVVEPFQQDGVIVSSSRVRTELESGEVTRAAALLGRPHAVEGLVIEGARRGRTIGFPTANLGGVMTLLPSDGVYAVRAAVDGKEHAAAANIGPNPTFGENARKIEVHLLDFAGDLYGKTMRVAFIKRLRATRPFASAADLVEQLNRDIEQAREALSVE